MFSSYDMFLKGKDILIFYCYIADEKIKTCLTWKNLFNLSEAQSQSSSVTE